MKDWDIEINRKWNGDKDVIYANKSEVMFRHGEDLNSLKNINLGGALMVQAEEMRESDFWFLVGRLRRKWGTLQLRIEANYDGHNWIWKIWKKRDFKIPEAFRDLITPEDFFLIETNTLENKANLPPVYIASLAMLPDNLRKRHFYGSWDEMEGQIWPMFTEQDHVIEPFTIPKHWHRFCSLDTPVASGTMAGIWFAVDENSNLYAYDEYQVDGTLISKHCEGILIISASEVKEYIADTSAFNKTREKEGQLYSVADEFRDYGIELQRAEKDVYAGINRVGEYLQKKRLKVFRNCVKLIEAIPQYRWVDLKPTIRGEQQLVPLRINTHLVEALRYGIMSRPYVNILDRTPKIEEGTVAWYLEQDRNFKEDWRKKYAIR